MPRFSFGETDSKENKQARERHQEAMKKYEQEMAQYGKQMEKYAREAEAMTSQRAEASTRHREMALQRQEQAMKRHAANMKRHEENMRRHEVNMERHRERSEMMENVRKEIIKDGLLKEGEQISDFKINKEGLYINGQKQSDALYQKYRNLMKDKEGKHIDLIYKSDGQNVQIQSSQQ